MNGLKNIFAEGELEGKSVAEDSSVTAVDGKNYRTKLYTLEAIQADQQDEADLKALETKLKGRPKK